MGFGLRSKTARCLSRSLSPIVHGLSQSFAKERLESESLQLRLVHCLMVDQNFERAAHSVGAQQLDPGLDFRGAGLERITHLLRARPHDTTTLIPAAGC